MFEMKMYARDKLAFHPHYHGGAMPRLRRQVVIAEHSPMSTQAVLTPNMSIAALIR